MNNLMPKVQNPESIAIWTKRISECKSSGMPTQEWCTANGINIKTYYYWHNKIHKMVQKQSAFYEIPMTEPCSQGTPAATIRFGSIQADVYSGADEGFLMALCRAMKSC